LAPVAQRLDNAIHRINHSPVDKCNKTNHAIRWIAIYPVDSVIQLLNNSGLVGKRPGLENGTLNPETSSLTIRP